MFLDDPLTIERHEGKVPGTRILRLTGPLTLRNLFTFQDELRSGEPPLIAIFDLTAVPYLDSAGMGALINYFVHCEKNGIQMIVAGVSLRGLELFKMTKVDTVIPLVATLEEAEVRVAAGGRIS
ncbi:MAG: STAS domain-containing protein [Terracidiphilus sp.]|jgi:anti-sigma B factor antagonist